MPTKGMKKVKPGELSISEESYRSILQRLGRNLSNIINQDGDDKIDGQIIDEIVEYLKRLKIYEPRK